VDVRWFATIAGVEEARSHSVSSRASGAAPGRPGVWRASRGNIAWQYRQYCAGRPEDLGRLGACRMAARRVSKGGSTARD
jgi:hypothetical protein